MSKTIIIKCGNDKQYARKLLDKFIELRDKKNVIRELDRNYFTFISVVFDRIIRKIQRWWKEIYLSSYTKVGKRVRNREFEMLMDEDYNKETEYNSICNLKSIYELEIEKGYFNVDKFLTKKSIYEFNPRIIICNNIIYCLYLKNYIITKEKNILNYFINNLENKYLVSIFKTKIIKLKKEIVKETIEKNKLEIEFNTKCKKEEYIYNIIFRKRKFISNYWMNNHLKLNDRDKYCKNIKNKQNNKYIFRNKKIKY